MKNLTYIHKVNGKIEDREKLIKWFNNYLDKCNNGDWMVEFVQTPRTDVQNKYYWVIVGIIAQSLGTSALDLHEYFKKTYLPSQEYFVVIKKKQLTSTTELTKDEMGTLIDNVIQFAAEYGVIIPDLEEYKHTH